MNIKIYQIDLARDKNKVKFASLSRISRYQGTDHIDPGLYDEVFAGEVSCTDLEEVFFAFETNAPPLHRGHSLAVSDVVVTESGAFYCDRVGFKKVEFDESKTHKPDNLLKVVYVEPNKPAYAAELEDTLRAKQRAVRGHMEVVSNGDGTLLVCNQEAKLKGMEGNRRIRDGKSIIAGPFFVVGVGEEDFRSLTDEEIQKYIERFSEPEEITQEEVESDTGWIFIPLD